MNQGSWLRLGRDFTSNFIVEKVLNKRGARAAQKHPPIGQDEQLNLSRTVMHLDIIKIDAESRFAGKRSQGRLDRFLR